MTTRKTLIRRISIVAGILVVLAIVAFGPPVISHFTKKSPSPALATVEPRSFPIVAQASGTLMPAQLENVNFATSGQIASIAVQSGQRVVAGAKLAQLADASQQAELSAAEAAVAAAQQAVSYAINQYGSGSTQAAQAEAQLASAEAQLTRAQQDESHTVLLAPESGTVLQINAQVGDTVNAGATGPPAQGGSGPTPFMVIGNGTTFVIQAAFSQQDAATLQVGQPGTVSVDALLGLTLPCVVTTVASSATQVNGVPEYFASLTLKSTDPRLRDGMTGNVTVNVAQADNVLAVPNQALFTLDNNAIYVDVWYHDSAVPTQVTTGLIGQQLTQITSGLTSGEQVLLAPATQGLPSAAPSPSAT